MAETLAVRDGRKSGGRAWWRGRQLVEGTPLRPAFAPASYLESLLMTRMRAPFSSFSLWLSDFSSVKICGETKTRWDHGSALPAGRALRLGGSSRDAASPPPSAFSMSVISLSLSPGFLQTGHQGRRGREATRALQRAREPPEPGKAVVRSVATAPAPGQDQAGRARPFSELFHPKPVPSG